MKITCKRHNVQNLSGPKIGLNFMQNIIFSFFNVSVKPCCGHENPTNINYHYAIKVKETSGNTTT